MQDEEQRAYDEIERSAALRAALRRRFPADRDARLQAQLVALSAAREPLRRHLLRAPKATARFFAPTVRKASEAITAERKRVQRMLYGKPGREKRARRKPRPRVKIDHLRGTVQQAKGELSYVRDELEAMSQTAAKPVTLERGFEIRQDARALHERAREARLRIGEAQKRLKLAYVFQDRPPRDLDRWDEEAEQTKRGLLKWEEVAARLSNRSPEQPQRPSRRVTPAWERETAIAALDDWAARRDGNWPKARDLPNHPSLPSRGTLGLLGISLVRDSPQARAATH